jgi:hypothetical protein
MQWQGPVTVLDGGRLGSHIENLKNDTGPGLSVTLTRDGLMKYGGSDMIVHNHACSWNQRVASYAVQDRVPLILTAHGKDGMHLLSIGSMKDRNVAHVADGLRYYNVVGKQR